MRIQRRWRGFQARWRYRRSPSARGERLDFRCDEGGGRGAPSCPALPPCESRSPTEAAAAEGLRGGASVDADAREASALPATEAVRSEDPEPLAVRFSKRSWNSIEIH